MIIPVFPSHQKNLNLYYINLPKLINFLKKDLFTGYLHILSSKEIFFVFFEQGEIYKIYRKKGDQYIKESDEYLNFPEEGELSIYPLPEDTIFFWANLFDAKVLYPNLSSEFTNFVKLINKLKKEELTGFLEIAFNDKQKSEVFFINGDIIGLCSSWNSWFFEVGEEKITEITGKISNTIFNVYSISLEKFSQKEIDLKKIINFFEKLFILIEKKLGFKNFSLLWRQVGMELSEKYPFLDPFANQFEYFNGKITIRGNIPSREILDGLKELSSEVISRKKLQNFIKDEFLNKEENSRIAKNIDFRI